MSPPTNYTAPPMGQPVQFCKQQISMALHIIHPSFVKFGQVESDISRGLARLLSMSMCTKFHHSGSNRSRDLNVWPLQNHCVIDILRSHLAYECSCICWVLSVCNMCTKLCYNMNILDWFLYMHLCARPRSCECLLVNSAHVLGTGLESIALRDLWQTGLGGVTFQNEHFRLFVLAPPSGQP